MNKLQHQQSMKPRLLEVIVAAVVYLAFLYGLAPAVAQFFATDIIVMGLALAALSGIMGLVAFAAAYMIRIRRLSAFGIRKVSRRQVLLGIAYGIIAVILTRVIYIAIYFSGISLIDVQQSYQSAATGGALTFIFQFIFGAILTPIGEEVAFRGVLTNALERFGPWISVSISTIIFAVVHGFNAAFVPAVVVGALAAILFHRTQSVWPGVIVHFINNGTGVLLSVILAAFAS